MGLGEGRKDHESKDRLPEPRLTFELPVRFKRRGAETKLILVDEHGPKPKPAPVLIKAVAEAHGWLEELRRGTSLSVGAQNASNVPSPDHDSKVK